MVRAVLIASVVGFFACGAPQQVSRPGDAGTSDRPGEVAGDVALPVIAADDVIDDLEDGDDAIFARGFRVGFWYVFNDDTEGGVQTPPPAGPFAPSQGGAGNSSFHARTTGAGFVRWGAGMGLDLNNLLDPGSYLPTHRMTFDAGSFRGVMFSAKGNMPMRFAVATADVVTIEWKGTCIETSNDEPVCDRAHEVPIALTSEWRTFVVPFTALTQPGPGPTVPFDPYKAMALHFRVDPSPGRSFDIAVDDIAFFK